MIDENQIRTRLIESCHSSPDAREFFKSRLDDTELLSCLVEIALDENDHGGDAPMEAAHYISRFPASLIATHEDKLIAALPNVNGYGGAIALALGKAKSIAAKSLIIEELGDGTRFDSQGFRAALELYGKDETIR